MTPADPRALCLLFIIPLTDALINPTWWSSVAQLGAHSTSPVEPERLNPLSGKNFCSRLEGLSSGQARICELFVDHMGAVGQGARQAIDECQWQFKDKRWNCSTPYGSGYFGPVHILGTREAAFTYAIISASVTHEVGRSCRLGLLQTCSCSKAERPVGLPESWMWAGCGDNIEYGYEFSRNFIDVREKEHTHPKRSTKYGRTMMNRWNNEAGRRVIKRMTRPHCKCHGVSGSCNLKTCWRQLPDMRLVGDQLSRKYQQAVRVRINDFGNLQIAENTRRRGKKSSARRQRKSARRMDLVYMDESPDYCRQDPGVGTMGTRGRACNRTSDGADSCELLCCGRGYDTVKMVVRDKCDCKFQWCCKVVCNTCVQQISKHICK